jgi:hypothetical protein
MLTVASALRVVTDLVRADPILVTSLFRSVHQALVVPMTTQVRSCCHRYVTAVNATLSTIALEAVCYYAEGPGVPLAPRSCWGPDET